MMAMKKSRFDHHRTFAGFAVSFASISRKLLYLSVNWNETVERGIGFSWQTWQPGKNLAKRSFER